MKGQKSAFCFRFFREKGKKPEKEGKKNGKVYTMVCGMSQSNGLGTIKQWLVNNQEIITREQSRDKAKPV